MIEIDVTKALKMPGRTFEFSYAGTPDYPGISFRRPLNLRAEYSVVDGAVRVRGAFEAALDMRCTRCLGEVAYAVRSDFDELFQKSRQDMDEYVYAGETVPLDKMVYDAILLDIPQQLLCGEDCAGLCGRCGANLNAGPCACKKDEADEDNPFAKLKELDLS